MAHDEAEPVADASTSPDTSSIPAGVGGTQHHNSAASWQGKRVGHFRIVGFLGRGAMGRVFRAEDVRLKRHVALKVFPTILDQGKRRVRLERFIREARSAAALDHPGIVRVYEADEFKGWYYIAMELVEGGTVGRLIEANGPFDMARGCAIGAEVGEALEFAHDHGVIHRDVKPDNILLARGGRAKLTDFGLAFRSDPNDSFHVVDEAVGTAFFIAPEIARGHGATALSDQYSLAGTVWAILAGKPPFPGTTREELIKHQVSTPVPKLRAVRPDLPQGLCKAIERALSKNPEDRYPMTEQFAKVLRVYTIGPGASAGASGSFPSVAAEGEGMVAASKPKASGNNRTAIYGGAAAAVLALGAAGVYLATRGSDGEKPPADRPVASNDKPDASTPPVAKPPTPVAPVVAVKPADPAKPPAALPAGDRFVFAGFDDNSRGTFDYAPDASGSTQGILKASTNTLFRDPARGLVQKLTILDDTTKTAQLDKTEGWFIRHISGHDARRDQNTPRPTKGWVGLWAMTTTPGVRVSIAIDNEQNVTADRGLPQALVPDGQWHCYEWNLEDNTFWQKWLTGDGLIDGKDFTLDSIHIWGPNADATIFLDDVSHNATGRVAPVDPAVPSPKPSVAR